MTYNIFISYGMGDYTILAVPEKHLNIIVDAWLNGDTSFFLSGNKYHCNHFNSLQIFKNQDEKTKKELENLQEIHGEGQGGFGLYRYFEVDQLEIIGDNITDGIIGDKPYGASKMMPVESELEVISDKNLYISKARIDEFKNLKNETVFDLSKLITVCEEVNDNYLNENYYSISLLLRTILNHVPPAFNDKDSFDQVLAEFNGKKHQTKKEIFPDFKSFKES
jgi:hypothetical protein